MNELTQQIIKYAESAVEAAQQRGEKQLDFSPSSLELLDEMAEEVVQCIKQISEAQVVGITQQFGCYILEVARQKIGGKYYWDEKKEQPVLVVGEPDSRIAMMTWDRVKGRLSGDPRANLSFFFKGFVEIVDSSKTGDDVLHV